MTDDRRLLPRYRTDQKPAESHDTTQRDGLQGLDLATWASSPAGKRAIRGIPLVGGTTGTIHGTDPERALLDRWCDCGQAKHPDKHQCRTCARIAS